MSINQRDLNNLANLANQMKGRPENEVIDELAQMIKSGQGGMTAEKVENMLELIMPMVDGEQRIKLNKLIAAIREE